MSQEINIFVIGEQKSGKSSVIFSLTHDKFMMDLPKVLELQSYTFMDNYKFNFIDSDCKYILFYLI